MISAIILDLPPTQLHLVPELLSEAVLGTKELNERARNAGFDLLVVMGNKMSQGGKLKSEDSLNVPNGDDTMDAGEELQAAPRGDVNASVEEFITMVAAGLTSTTPHMISASVSALTRLVFEFKSEQPILTFTLNEMADSQVQIKSPTPHYRNSFPQPRSSSLRIIGKLSSPLWVSSSSSPLPSLRSSSFLIYRPSFLPY